MMKFGKTKGMEGFRLLGIRPLKGCNDRFRKNLVPNKLYWFYKDFKCTLNEKGEIESINYKESYPTNLYSVKNKKEEDINIHISALVGKNGSGKSALSELFLLALFFISNKKDKYSGKSFINKNGLFFNEETALEKYENDEKIIKQGLKVEFYYVLNNNIFQIIVQKNKIEYRIAENVKNKFKFDNEYKEFIVNTNEKDKISPSFFYSVVINYSLYGFNTNKVGMWIKAFFHKNDGYQMPVVINPYRREGNIDINTEEYLTESRLLANVLSIEGFDNIYKKSSVKNIVIDYDKNRDKIHVINNERERILIPLFRKYFPKDKYEIDSERKKLAENYLIYKIEKVRLIIGSRAKDKVTLVNRLDDKIVDLIYEDRSHLTLKIRQTLYFIRKDIFFNDSDKTTFKTTLDLRAVRMEMKKLKQENENLNIELEELIPPPIFKSVIHFNDGSTFDSLSSGEKQLIYSINSIVYHIKNLDSVYKAIKQKKVNNESQIVLIKNKGLIKYDSVNLILDEVELYYHPEFQRQTISQLLSVIEMAKFEYIKNINILFLTHSPFILSDIPTNNVLKLRTKEDNSNTSLQKTFGANIHELLGDNFFLKEGYVGEFAKKKIEELILFYNKKNNSFQEGEALQIISLIDDELISDRLLEMHNEYFKKTKETNITDFNEEHYKKWLKEELERISKG